MYVLRNTEARSLNHCCQGRAISIIYSECMSAALVNQHAMRIRRNILSFVGRPALPYFFTLSYKRYDFMGKVTEHEMCVLISLRLRVKYFSPPRRTERDMIKNI